MSLFLGKIHYWLFNKILWFEALEKEMIKLAKEEGIDIDTLRKPIVEKYGEETKNLPLEEMIDTSNIHGWLQATIHSAEGRMAALTKIILEKEGSKEALEKLYIAQGVLAANEVRESGTDLKTAPEIYNSINDYILDGMPCDRVNEVLSSSDTEVIWTRTICVHKDIWEREGVNVDLFYELRSLWIKSFVNAVNDKFSYIEENNTFIIRKN
ncbi:hypothetical protein [uncultured Clostridium sp.]|uniref:hypothetical protein n=1 Tax=uncultured Clostridium sp. TaxID=59620 RepID=UPI0026009B37|nr:hypothetical protein [uncultured Clostridium sp.]